MKKKHWQPLKRALQSKAGHNLITFIYTKAIATDGSGFPFKKNPDQFDREGKHELKTFRFTYL
jgi:hypothetical protein